mgnify:CR=1 FL=1
MKQTRMTGRKGRAPTDIKKTRPRHKKQPAKAHPAHYETASLAGGTGFAMPGVIRDI